MRAVLRRFLTWWKPIAEKIVQVQTAIILSLLYIIAVGPMAIGARLFGQDLLKKRRPRKAPSYWQDKAPLSEDLQLYRHQF